MNTVAVIPSLNEEKTIKEVVTKTSKYVDKVIVVNAGSTDRTTDILNNIKSKKLIVITKEINKGKGFSLRKGLKKALELNPKYIVFLDADGEKDPRNIPKFLKTLEKSDMVVGKRDKMRSLSRALANKFTNFWVKVLTRLKLSDSCSGFVGIRADLVKKMMLVSKGFEIELELVLEAFRNKGRVREVSIDVPKISKSKLNIRNMVEINKFFDTWAIHYLKKTKINLLKKVFLLISCYTGLLVSLVILRGWEEQPRNV